MAELSDALKETILQDKGVKAAINNLKDLIPAEKEYEKKQPPITVSGSDGITTIKQESPQFAKAELAIIDAASKALKDHGISDAPTSAEMMKSKIGMGDIPNQEALKYETQLVAAAKSGEPLGPIDTPKAPQGEVAPKKGIGH